MLCSYRGLRRLIPCFKFIELFVPGCTCSNVWPQFSRTVVRSFNVVSICSKLLVGYQIRSALAVLNEEGSSLSTESDLYQY